METESGKEGYVGSSTKCARRLSELGLGEWTQDIGMPDTSNYYQMKPGDIMSINGHVWISLGTCEDGQPRVRPFGTIEIFEGKLYIQTGSPAEVSR